MAEPGEPYITVSVEFDVTDDGWLESRILEELVRLGGSNITVTDRRTHT